MKLEEAFSISLLGIAVMLFVALLWQIKMIVIQAVVIALLLFVSGFIVGYVVLWAWERFVP